MNTTIPVKICCIQSEAELALALRHGARAVGFVSTMPSGWGPIPDQRIATLVPHVPPTVSSVLLTSAQDPDTILAQQRVTRANTLQIVDHIELEHLTALRNALPGITLLKAVHVTGPEAVETAQQVAPLVDGLILDTGAPHGDVKVLGGTGQTHDWSISRQIVLAVNTPVFLAGGLKPHNIAEALRTVEPFGIDVCTGVRVNHALDDDLLGEFFTAISRFEQR